MIRSLTRPVEPSARGRRPARHVDTVAPRGRLPPSSLVRRSPAPASRRQRRAVRLAGVRRRRQRHRAPSPPSRPSAPSSTRRRDRRRPALRRGRRVRRCRPSPRRRRRSSRCTATAPSSSATRPRSRRRLGLGLRRSTRSGPRSSARSRSRTCSTFALGEGGLGAARAEYHNHDGRRRLDRDLHDRRRRAARRRSPSTRSGMETRGVAGRSGSGGVQRAGRSARATSTSGGAIADRRLRPDRLPRRSCWTAPGVDPDAIAWPWTDLAPADFAAPADPNALPVAGPHHDPAEVDGARRSTVPRAASRACPSPGPTTARSTRSRCARCCPDETE